jgi:hypothetical protein
MTTTPLFVMNCNRRVYLCRNLLDCRLFIYKRTPDDWNFLSNALFAEHSIILEVSYARFALVSRRATVGSSSSASVSRHLS